MKLSGGQRIAALVAAATLAAAGVAVVAVAEPSFQASSFAASPSSAPSGGLTVAPFASRYGRTPAAVTALESYLNGYGISASVYPDDLDVTANGTVAQFNSALSVQQRQYKVPAVPAHDSQAAIPAQQVHGTEGDP